MDLCARARVCVCAFAHLSPLLLLKEECATVPFELSLDARRSLAITCICLRGVASGRVLGMACLGKVGVLTRGCESRKRRLGRGPILRAARTPKLHGSFGGAPRTRPFQALGHGVQLASRTTAGRCRWDARTRQPRIQWQRNMSLFSRRVSAWRPAVVTVVPPGYGGPLRRGVPSGV